MTTNSSTKYRILNHLQLSHDTRLTLETLLLHDGEIENHDERLERLLFHLEAQDYFGTVSTILKILAEEKMIASKHLNEVLSALSKDMDYLQNNYHIIKK